MDQEAKNKILMILMDSIEKVLGGLEHVHEVVKELTLSLVKLSERVQKLEDKNG